MIWDHLNSVLDEATDPDDIETDVDPTEPSDEEARRRAGADLDAEEGKPKGNPPPTAIETLDGLLGRLRRGEGDTLFDVGDALTGFEVGPGLITAIGAPPGYGKTTLGMQAIFAAVSNQPKLQALVANAEMPLAVLLKRELTRRSGVSSRALRFADLTPHQLQSVETAAEELRPLLSHVESLSPPFTIGKLVTACSERPPGLVIVDYLQKFADGGSDARQGVNAVMTGLRQIASEGWAVLAMSATTRTKSASGSGHDSKSLTMASMKESGEIEFNADSEPLIHRSPIQNRPLRTPSADAALPLTFARNDDAPPPVIEGNLMTKTVPPTSLADRPGSGRQTAETQGRWRHVLSVVPVVAILAVDTRTAVQEIAIQREPGVFL